MSTFSLFGLAQLSVTINLVVAAVLGALIGLERQMFQHYTGVTTHALVALGAAAFVSISALVSDVADVTRIAGQVVSGIGFLGAGLIFRDGMSIRGLSAAASMWATGAVGALAGFGYLIEASEVAVLMFLVNIVLPHIGRFTERLRRPGAMSGVEYAIELTCRVSDEAEVRGRLLEAITGAELRLQGIESVHPPDMNTAHIEARVHAARRDDAAVEIIVGTLGLSHAIRLARWHVTGGPV